MSVGKSVHRKDALDKVTGAAKFIDDYKFNGMIYAVVLRSPVAHCLIKTLDFSDALSVDGVVDIVTYKDIPGENIIPIITPDFPFLAEKECKYAGEPIAVLGAETRSIAEEAVKLIKFDYEELPASLEPEDSLKPDAPYISGDNNILKSFRIIKGDVDKALKKSDIVLENTFTTGYQEHAYMEPQGMIAVPEPDDVMVVYGSMQCPFYVRNAVSAILNKPMSKCRIIQTVTGGAFGGKEDIPSIVAGQAALLAYKTNRPVKLIYTREEDIISMTKRHPSKTKIRIGAKRNGKLTAVDVDFTLNGGAYTSLSGVVLWRGTVHAAGPYKCDNVRIISRAVATHTVPNGAYRGFGQPQSCFAIESMMDELAIKLKIDPFKLREINGLEIGDTTATGHKLKYSVGYKECLKKAKKASGWNKKRIKKAKGNLLYGRGMSTAFYGVGLGAEGKPIDRAGAYIQITDDASIILAIGQTEMGQGAITCLSQIAAEALGAPLELVYMLNPDTSRVPDSGPTVASRTTVMTGNAIKDAAEKIRKNMNPVIAKLLNTSITKIVSKDGYFYSKKNPRRKISFKDVVTECYRRRIHTAAQGWYVPPDTSFDEKTGHGDAYFVYTFATYVVELYVDTSTGRIFVERITNAIDIGKAINPDLCKGQIEGGNIQGMGLAISEKLITQNGIFLNPNFTNYIIPTSSDVPELHPIIVEHPYPDGPYGAKGLGEAPLIGIPPAIANAIYDATGVRVNYIPLYPEDLYKTLKENMSGEK